MRFCFFSRPTVGSLSSVSTWSPLQAMVAHCSADILIPLNPTHPQPGTPKNSPHNTWVYHNPASAVRSNRARLQKNQLPVLQFIADKVVFGSFTFIWCLSFWISVLSLSACIFPFACVLPQWARWKTRLPSLHSVTRQSPEQTGRAALLRHSSEPPMQLQHLESGFLNTLNQSNWM